jgi:ATP-binding cassette subfamily C protein
MDEATSALDNLTEKYIIEQLERLKAKITIIMIAHRLSTVKNCDKLFLLKEGRIVGEGTYNELVSSNEEFRKMSLIHKPIS